MVWRKGERGRLPGGDEMGGGEPEGPLLPESIVIILIFALSVYGALHRLFG